MIFIVPCHCFLVNNVSGGDHKLVRDEGAGEETWWIAVLYRPLYRDQPGIPVRGLFNLNIDRYLHCGDFQERGPKAPSCSEKGQEISKPPTPQLSHSLFGVGLICIRIYRSIDVNAMVIKEEPYLFTFSLVTTSALL